MLAVVTANGVLLGLHTSGVDAHLQCKSVLGSRVWRCAPNSCDATEIKPTVVRQTGDGPDTPCRDGGGPCPEHKERQSAAGAGGRPTPTSTG